IVRRIDELFAIERAINGEPPEARRAARQEQSKPLVAALEAYMREQLGRLSPKNDRSRDKLSAQIASSICGKAMQLSAASVLMVAPLPPTSGAKTRSIPSVSLIGSVADLIDARQTLRSMPRRASKSAAFPSAPPVSQTRGKATPLDSIVGR